MLYLKEKLTAGILGNALIRGQIFLNPFLENSGLYVVLARICRESTMGCL